MITNSLIAWNNYAKNATITATSAASSFPASNVAGDLGAPSSGWQTVYGVTTSAGGAVLTITPTNSGLTWDLLGIFRTNLTASATVTFSLYSYIGGTPAVTWTTGAVQMTSGNGQYLVYTGGVVADFLQISFNDANNPDGYINVPLVFGGSAWDPLGVISFNSTFGRDTSQVITTSRGGQEYPTFYYQQRRWNVAIDTIRESEAWSYVDQLMQVAAIGSNVLLIPDVNSPYLQKQAVFGLLKSSSDISYPSGASDRRKWSFQVTERL